jgi:hypothetical protein
VWLSKPVVIFAAVMVPITDVTNGRTKRCRDVERHLHQSWAHACPSPHVLDDELGLQLDCSGRWLASRCAMGPR